VFLAATASVSFFYIATVRELGLGWWDRIKYLPFLMSLGIGLSINQSRAVIEALLHQESEFARTPKTGSEGNKVQKVQKAYKGRRTWVPYVELGFAAYFAGAIWYAFDHDIYASMPYLVLFMFGYLYVGLTSMFDFNKRRQAAETVSGEAQPTV